MLVINEEVTAQRPDEGSTRKILGCGGSLMMVEVTVRKGNIGKAHSHDRHEQVCYIVKGSFEVTVGNETKILKQGDSYYVPLNTMHGVEALEDSVMVDVFTPIREDFLEAR
jgi:quercetin dioxygenase-like cupin family protein